MSASSGITVSQDLTAEFAHAIESQATRFIKVIIENESLVHVQSIPVQSKLEDDLSILQGPDILQDTSPAYVLAQMDGPSAGWLIIYYVPDAAKVRDKMLYASTRASLLKSLGSTLFSDSIFATSKADLTPEAYAAHRRHLEAPKPLSTREQEMAEVRAAEASGTYEGSRARVNHVGAGVGLNWSEPVVAAVQHLGEGSNSFVVIIKIDSDTETLVLDATADITADVLGSSLPQSEPCYAFFAWPHSHGVSPRRDIVFIYSCPSNSPIKPRMVYSSGSSSVFQAAKMLLIEGGYLTQLLARKIETSDPTELNEAYLKSELGLDQPADSFVNKLPADEQKTFARPRGPAKRQR